MSLQALPAPAQRLFRCLFEQASLGIAVEDLDGKVLLANPALCSMLGYTEMELCGMSCSQFANPEDSKDDWALFQQLRAGVIDRYSLEKRYVRKDGAQLWGRLNVSLLKESDDEGSPLVFAFVEEITERKRAEEALRKSEEKFSKAFRQSPMALTLTRATDHRYLDVNETFERITGWCRDEVVGRTPLDIGIWVDSTQRLEFAKRFLAEGSIRDWEVHYRTKDGTQRVGLGAGELIQIGNEPCILSVIADITERKRAEEALHESEERLRLAAEAGKMYAYEWDPISDVVTRSEEHVNILGFRDPGEKLTRRQIAARVHPDDRAQFIGSVDHLTPENPTTQISYRVLRPDGSVIWLEKSGRAFFDPQGKLLRMTGMVADVTERMRTQEALRESEDKLRLLLDSTAEAIYGIDLEHRCTFCNPACLQTLGYEHVDEVLGKNMHDLIHHTRADGTSFPIEECRVHRVARTGEGVHAEDEVLWRANGTSFPAEYWSHPQRKGDEIVGAVVAFNDITERKLAEAALTNVSRKLIEAQEQERSRIGRELHDDIGQRLALLTVELHQLHDNSLILPEVRSRMGELQQKISEIAADIQSLSHELHSAKLQYLGISAAMRGFCRELGEQQKVEIDFQSHDLPGLVSADMSLCFFRVLQEALHNSVKHSGVRHFEVRLWGTSDEIHLTVRDSGVGFDREAIRMSQGLGLISMQERLKFLNGTLSIDSQPERGTTIHASVPLGSASDSMRAAG
jgi:PAS domain S-box-containing protein